VIYCNFAGALWSTTDNQSTGTGVIDSFVRIAGNTDEVQGMNTSDRPLLQNENNSPQFTHDIPEGIVPIVNISGANYYEFLLDINQTGADPFLTLAGLNLCQTASAQTAQANGVDACKGTPFYNLGANTVELDYADNSGSGSGDLFVYIPVPAGGIPDANFIYLWSQFGPTPNNNNDGFEEWAIRTTSPISPVPEPASLLLLGTGVTALGRYARRRLKAQKSA
jgi:hypothetical protein